MVKVWFVREGSDPTSGGPVSTLSLNECVQNFELSQGQFLCELSTSPRFGASDDPLAMIRGYTHVVVEVGEDEAKDRGWQSGYYRSSLSPQEAYERLGLPT